MSLFNLEENVFSKKFGKGVRSFTVSDAGLLYCGHTYGAISQWDANCELVDEVQLRPANEKWSVYSLAVQGNYLWFHESGSSPAIRMFDIRKRSEIDIPLLYVVSESGIFFSCGRLFAMTPRGIAIINFFASHGIILKELQESIKQYKEGAIYRNNLKNRDCGKEAPQNCDSERATIAQGQGASENRNFEVKPTQPNPNSSDYFGITDILEKFPKEIKKSIQYDVWDSFSPDQKIQALQKGIDSLVMKI